MAPLSKVQVLLLLLICTTQASLAQAPQKTNITNFKIPLQIIQKPPPTWMKGHGEITLMIYVDGTVLLSWHQNKHSAKFKTEELIRNLQQIPISDWPDGRIISVSKCAIQSGSSADCERNYQRSLKLINRVLKELDITASFRPCA
ncbi:MAG: hypothetical protein IPP57_10465 [Candidatus Obscuribacter sp.]|nr:hypothetical protein [Candidatus Obscuribacter sp.]